MAAESSPKPVVLTQEQVATAVLTIDDLPADKGFLAISGDARVPDPMQTGGACNGPNFVSVGDTAGSSATGFAGFFNSNWDGPYVFEALLSFPSVVAAKKFMKLASTQAKSCKSGWQWAAYPEDPPTDYEIEPLPFKKLGDQVLATNTVGTGGSDDITRDPDLPRVSVDAVVRVGSHVVWTTMSGISIVMGSAPTELRGYAEKAVDHLADAVRTAKRGA